MNDLARAEADALLRELAAARLCVELLRERIDGVGGPILRDDWGSRAWQAIEDYDRSRPEPLRGAH